MDFLFILIITILFIHEMDAIKAKEWRMFKFLNRFEDGTSYLIFLFAHIPLYIFLIYVVINKLTSIYLIIDLLLVIHTIVHLFFEKNKNNHFQSVFSKLLIYLLGFLALLHFIMSIIYL